MSGTKVAGKRSTSSSRISVMVGRFGSDPETLTVKANGTVDDVLEKAGINLSEGERAWLNGGRAKLTDKVRKGDIVSVVVSKEAGLL